MRPTGLRRTWAGPACTARAACIAGVLVLLAACGGGGGGQSDAGTVAPADPGAFGSNFRTSFYPPQDGFQVANRGSEYNREGECFGMTSFSLWFYANAKSSRGSLFPQYDEVVAQDASGAPLRGQNIIATRAYISIGQKWDLYYPAIAAQDTLTDTEIAASILNALINTGNPVLVYLSRPGHAHSVLAYGYAPSASGGSFHIYDPNHPADAGRFILYDGTSGFQAYCQPGALCYERIRYAGDGSLKLAEPFENILTDADLSFMNSANASIALASHRNGEAVDSGEIVLSGRVESSQVLVDTLSVIVGSAWHQVPVGFSGDFSIPVALSSGTNHFQFETKGNDSTGNQIALSNNMQLVDFTLVLNGPATPGDQGGRAVQAVAPRPTSETEAPSPASPTARWLDARALRTAGGEFRWTVPDSRQNVWLVVPAGAAHRDFDLRLGVHPGAFRPKAGAAGGAMLVLESDLRQFDEAVQIRIALDQGPRKRVPVAYALDADGRVRLLDSTWDRSLDVLRIYTFRPIVFTWVFN